MRKSIKKRRFYLIRPIDGLLPIMFMAADLMGPHRFRGWFFTSWFVARMFSLFSADGVRMAFATQPGMKKVRGSTTMALLLQIFGAICVISAVAFIYRGISLWSLALTGIGLLLNIEQVFAECMRAQGDGYSADLCTLLTSVFFFTGVMLEPTEIPITTLAMTGIGCLITLLLAVLTGGYRPSRLNKAVITHIPRSLIYGVAYPAAYFALIFTLDMLCRGNSGKDIENIWNEKGLLAGFYAGLAVIQVIRTPFRRSEFECRTLWRVLAAIAFTSAAVLCGMVFIPGIPGHISGFTICFTACILVSAIAASLMWGNFRKSE